MYSRITANDGTVIVDFVYDCGANNHHKRINEFLGSPSFQNLSYFKNQTTAGKPIIKYLYISHFDSDHINGIKKLETSKFVLI